MKKLEGDYIFISLKFPYGIRDSLGYAQLLPALQMLESTSFPKPTMLEFSGKTKNRMRKKTIHSYLDPQVLAVLEPNGPVGADIALYNQPESLRVSISQASLSDHFILSIQPPLVETLNEETFKKVLVDLVHLFPNVSVARCNFVYYVADFNRKYMNPSPELRNILVWLQYLSPKKLAIQGGRAVFEENALLQTEPLEEGLLVQVGESPYDIYTDEGEALLVQATFSLPPIQRA